MNNALLLMFETSIEPKSASPDIVEPTASLPKGVKEHAFAKSLSVLPPDVTHSKEPEVNLATPTSLQPSLTTG